VFSAIESRLGQDERQAPWLLPAGLGVSILKLRTGVANQGSELKLSLSKVPILDRSERLEDEDP